MHGGDDLLVLVRPGDGEDAGVRLPDAPLLHAHAAGDDDAAVLGHGLADGLQAFGLGGVEEAAGVDHHHVGARVVGRDQIAFRAQLGEDAFRIDERLGAAQRDEADLGRGFGGPRWRGLVGFLGVEAHGAHS